MAEPDDAVEILKDIRDEIRGARNELRDEIRGVRTERVEGPAQARRRWAILGAIAVGTAAVVTCLVVFRGDKGDRGSSKGGGEPLVEVETNTRPAPVTQAPSMPDPPLPAIAAAPVAPPAPAVPHAPPTAARVVAPPTAKKAVPRHKAPPEPEAELEPAKL